MSETHWIAEREFELREEEPGEPRKVFARIGAPEQVEDFWRCATLIEGAPVMSDEFHAFGEDSLQALQLALQGLAARLSAVGRAGVLTWLGDRDLGFNSPSGDES